MSSPPTNRISTGIVKLDAAIGGGLEAGEFLEIYGKSSVGKSQMCQTILAEFCHRRTIGTALYIDAKNDLIASRIFDIFEKCQPSMRRVRVVKESTAKNILKVLKYFDQELTNGQSQFCENLKVILIDSLPAIFYGIQTEDNESWKAEVEQFTAQLRNMASKHGLVVILINHAVSVSSFQSRDKRTRDSLSSNINVKPALGKFWIPVPDFRFLLTRVSNLESLFRATLEKGIRGIGIAEYQFFDFRVTDLGVMT